MNSVVILAGEPFTLTSYGNGTAYSLRNAARKQSIFVQGDDAAAFREEMERREEFFPDMLSADLLREMWWEYSPLARPDE